MKKKTKQSSVQKEFHNLLADIDSLLKESANLTEEEFSEARDKLQEKVTEAKDTVFEISSNINNRAKKSAIKANRRVHEEPWKAVAAGAIAGLLLGTLFNRR